MSEEGADIDQGAFGVAGGEFAQEFSVRLLQAIEGLYPGPGEGAGR